MLTELLYQKIAEYEIESRAYEEQSRRGADIFENARAVSYFTGKIEALTSVIQLMESQDFETPAVRTTPDCMSVN